MTVSELLEQPCNKSDDAIKIVPNLLQQLVTSSANRTSHAKTSHPVAKSANKL